MPMPCQCPRSPSLMPGATAGVPRIGRFSALGPPSRAPPQGRVGPWTNDQVAPDGGGRVSASISPPVDHADNGRRRRARSFGGALAWTVAATVLPGTAFLAAGRRRLGAFTLFLLALLIAGGVWLATSGRQTFIHT